MKHFALLILVCMSIAFVISINHPNSLNASQEIAQARIVSETLPTPVEIVIPVIKEEIKPFKILLVPGHDVDFGGASFRGINERDLAVIVSNKIAELFNGDKNYELIVARDDKKWNPLLADYFSSKEQEIIDFKSEKQAADKILIKTGEKKVVEDKSAHSNVNKKTSIQLYGINKWSNENNVDLVLHVHFNDSGRSNMNLPGGYKGFSIYIPERQMINSSTSTIIAEDIYEELKQILTPEVIGSQKNSIVEDQSLIAIGGSGTLDKPAMLVEYGYIYEKPFRTETDREIIFDKMAEKTVLGIKNYVNFNK